MTMVTDIVSIVLEYSQLQKSSVYAVEHHWESILVEREEEQSWIKEQKVHQQDFKLRALFIEGGKTTYPTNHCCRSKS